ncbi:hypothetical protein O181_046572 [Austropuccinia psidii MF-1]|uniref:Uncharacterized protein n=1 Tax=Austropuccinia psidii MF-1 TaxID=1389203 RepID=A0A9Q3DRI7_9BASI|nr:hypothetical protein [Austropuccinia psidii MF-1]
MNPQPLMPTLATPIVFNNGVIPTVPGPTLEDPFALTANPLVSPEVPILVTRKDGGLGKLERDLVVQDEVDTDAEGSDELDGEELEMTTK